MENITTIMYQHVIAKVCHLANQLGILNLILEGNQSTTSLAEKFNFKIAGMEKLLRILDAYDVIEYENDIAKANKNTKKIAVFDSDHILLSYKVLEDLEQSYRLMQPVFAKAYGTDYFTYLDTHGGTKKFRDWCAKTARLWLPPLLTLYQFDDVNTIADIGGGDGTLMGLILQKYDQINATLFDRESVLKEALSTLEYYQVEDRTKVVAGDFFDESTIPPQQDIYIICRTLLNWSDEDAITIINNCAKVMSHQSRVLIVDFFIPEKNHPSYKTLVLNDSILLANFGSANRTIKQWQTLADATSLKRTKCLIHEAKAGDGTLPLCVIELVR